MSVISGIVCVDKNWAIGKNDAEGKPQLLFKLPEDLKMFKRLTTGMIVVMGYTTYLSLPKKPLPGRINLVLWDKATSPDVLPGCITFNNFDNLLHFVKILSKQYHVFVIGGASVYKLFLPYYDSIAITKVSAEDKDATAFFPNLDELEEFELCDNFIAEDNGYIIRFCDYHRK